MDVVLITTEDELITTGRLRAFDVAPGVLYWQGSCFRYSHDEGKRRVYVLCAVHVVIEF